MKILFCNIAWMKYYQGTCEDDIPINGGSYVDENHDANEALNFLPIIEGDGEEERTVVFGSFETKSTNGKTVNQVHIEKIRGCEALINEDYAEGVLVIWCATSPTGESRVVGWYNNATVFRNYESITIELDDGSSFERIYNIVALDKDAVLLPESKRNRFIWKVPRKNMKSGTPYGFFRANVWYALEEKAEDYIKQLIERIKEYEQETGK